MNSKKIYEELRKNVVGQDEYIKQLVIFAYKHLTNKELIENGKRPISNNLLVVGPTGTGKTYGAKQLAKLIDVPILEVDCSNIVQTGYRGNNSVEDILPDALHRFGSKAKNCVIYLDEFDKIYDLALDKDGKGKASQQNFLKMLEPNELTCERDRDRSRSSYNFDTSGISFIASGSFDLISRDRNTNKMGFNTVNNIDSYISKDDIVKAGFIPELIGRFNTIVNLNSLSEDDYYRILSTCKNSVYSQYKDLLKQNGVKLTIDDKVLHLIAHKTSLTNFGARGLEQIIANYFDECLYDMAIDSSISQIKLSVEDGEVVKKYNYKIGKGEQVYAK